MVKASDTKTSAKTASKQPAQPFFNGEGSHAFFGRSVSADKGTSPFFVQPKLKIGEPNDHYEREADNMADKVIQRLTTKETAAAPALHTTPANHQVQSKCEHCEQEEKLQEKEEKGKEKEWKESKIQRKPIFDSDEEPPELPVQRKEDSDNNQSDAFSIESNLNASKGAGSPLPDTISREMGSAMGADFSGVRVHNDSNAVRMSKDLNAQAFTHGNDIYFNSGKYDADSNPGKHLLAHELTHTIQQRRIPGNIIQNLPGQPVPIDCSFHNREKPVTVPNAASILVDRYPHLANVMDGSQMNQIQKVLDATEKMDELKLKQKPFRDRITIMGNGRGGASDDIDSYDYYKRKIGDQEEIIGKNLVFYVKSQLLAADDILDAGPGASPPIQAFHEQLYERFISGLIRIEIHPCLAKGTFAFEQFLEFSWQAFPDNFWLISHDKGLIRFRSLMQFQGFNLNYQSLLYGELVDILGKMVELRRKMGDYYPEAVGKRIGVIDQNYIFSDDSVTVGSEIGDPNGYYNDGRGRMEMYNALFSPQLSKTARVVLRSKENWLHIFATDPNFDTTEMDDPIGERGWLFILTATKSPDIEIYEYFITKDGRDLQPATAAFDGPGWRTERELSEFEEFAIGFIFGDAFEANSGSAMFGQIVASLIPVVGQVADARDVAVGIHKIYTTGGKEGKLQTAFAFLGFVPFLGDFIKREGKVAKNAAPEVRAAVHTDAVVKASQDIGDGVVQKGGNKLLEATEKGGKQAAEDALAALPDIKRPFVDAVMTNARKNTDNVVPGLKQADEAASVATDAFGKRLPTLENPKLVAQSAFNVGEQVHYVKVVQIGNWKQVWICTQCGSLIARIDEALVDASGSVVDKLKTLRGYAVELEKKANVGKIKKADIDLKVQRISAVLNEYARRNPHMSGLAKGLQHATIREALLANVKIADAAQLERLLSNAKFAGVAQFEKILGNAKLTNATQLETILNNAKLADAAQLEKLLQSAKVTDAVQLEKLLNNAKILDAAELERLLDAVEQAADLEKLLTKMSGVEIENFINALKDPALFKIIAKKYVGEALLHYGPDFFRAYKGVDAVTMSHLLDVNVSQAKGISGCHDEAMFLAEMAKQPIGVKAPPGSGLGPLHPPAAHPVVAAIKKYTYQMWSQDGKGGLVTPLTPKAVVLEKTTINGLAGNQAVWQTSANQAADQAINALKFPKGDGKFTGVADSGLTWGGWFRGNKIDTIFVEF